MMDKRRLAFLALTATPAELRYLAGCIEVGKDYALDEDEYCANQADALASRLRSIAHAMETGRMDNTGYMIPFIQQGVAHGPESL